MGETVRFSEIMKAGGTPEIYLPLSDPKHDRDFMRAVREDRVLSIKQEPTGTRKDFGIVGFVPEKYVSYLIFPRSLKPFEGRRVIGIKYDALRQTQLSTEHASASPRSRSVKPKPRPKRFTATVRLTSTREVKVSVRAFDEEEARRKAEESARQQRNR